MTNFNFERHYVSLSLLLLLLIRILIAGASIGDSIAFLALTAFTGYSLYLQNRNRDFEQSQVEKLDQLASDHKAKSEHLQNELNALRQQVGLIKVDQGFSTATKQQPNPRIAGEKKRYF